jgi:glutamine amidotransferase
MCRHLGYLGEPVTLSELVLDPPHSLAVQSYAPKDMRGGGKVNVDGFGAGWFGAGSAEARRYRRAVPIWQDAAFPELARATTAVGVLAAVRNATAGMPIADAACAPFTDGHWLFSLNGYVAGWPDTATGLVAGVPLGDLLSMQVTTDAVLLWTVLRQRLAAAADPAAALGSLIAQVLAAAPGSRLTTLLTDGRQLWATTVTHSLWFRESATGVVLASEPFDDDQAWQPIPDGQLVVADRSGVDWQQLVAVTATADNPGSESHVHQRR